MIYCYVYVILCPKTRAEIIIQQDVFDRIQRHIAEFKSTYDANYRDVKFCVAGDMNGRTVCLPDYVVHDISKNLPLPDDYMEDNGPDMPHRTNCDKMINNYGRLLLDLCKMCSLRILNGRAGSDRGVGKWTCTKYYGQSVVVYVACTADLYDSIVSFNVSDPLPHSDHSVINFSLAVQKRNSTWNSRTVIIIQMGQRT